MNYAVAVAGAVWAFAIAYWFVPKIGGRHFFRSVWLLSHSACTDKCHRGPKTHDYPVAVESLPHPDDMAKAGGSSSVEANPDKNVRTKVRVESL
jgi:hypothetical protein